MNEQKPEVRGRVEYIPCVKCRGSGGGKYVGRSGEQVQLPCTVCIGNGHLDELLRICRRIIADVDRAVDDHNPTTERVFLHLRSNISGPHKQLIPKIELEEP